MNWIEIEPSAHRLFHRATLASARKIASIIRRPLAGTQRFREALLRHVVPFVGRRPTLPSIPAVSSCRMRSLEALQGLTGERVESLSDVRVAPGAEPLPSFGGNGLGCGPIPQPDRESQGADVA